MSLKSYLDPLVAFDKWIKVNPKGGIFIWQGQRFRVNVRGVLG